MEIFKSYIRKAQTKESLSYENSYDAFKCIMNGKATSAQIAAFLTLLSEKGETVEEVAGAAKAIRDCAIRVISPPDAIDVCGTGGDNSGTLNISTAVAFVVAGCGVPVAKHGNKAVSSKSGSADVLQQLGVKVDADIKLVEKSLKEVKLCFMMAPKFHTAMSQVATVRAEIGIRTIFNLLGPLCNPAFTKYHLLGVYDRRWVEPIARTLRYLGAESAWVVHGSDGLDELTTTGISYVAELKNGKITEFEITPEDAGLESTHIGRLKGHTVQYNAGMLEELLEGKITGPYRDIVLLNAAAALIVAGKADNLKHGVTIAAEAIDKGKAKAVLDNLIRITNS